MTKNFSSRTAQVVHSYTVTSKAQSNGEYEFTYTPSSRSGSFYISIDCSEIPIGATINEVTKITEDIAGSTAITISSGLNVKTIKTQLESGIRIINVYYSANSKAPNGTKGTISVNPGNVTYNKTISYTLEVDWTPAATVTVNKASYTVGETVTATISNLENVSKYTIEWFKGTNLILSESDQTATTQNYTYSANNLNTEENASCSCVVTSFNADGSELGSSQTVFIVTVPDNEDYKPKLNTNEVTVAPYLLTTEDGKSTDNKYYTNYTKAKISISATAGNGAALAYYIINNNTIAVNADNICYLPLTQSGVNNLMIAVQDTRGRKSEVITKEITVEEATLKFITCDINRSNSTQVDVTGEHAIIDYEINVPAIPGNSLQTLRYYWTRNKEGKDEDGNPIIQTGDASVGSLNTSDNIVLSQTFDSEASYSIYLKATDKVMTAESLIGTVTEARCNVHFAGTGYGVAFGTFCDSGEGGQATKDKGGEFKCAYPMSLKLGLNDDDAKYYTIRIGTSGEDGYITFVL